MFRHSCEAGIENAFGNCEAVYKCGFGQLQTTANVSWLLFSSASRSHTSNVNDNNTLFFRFQEKKVEKSEIALREKS